MSAWGVVAATALTLTQGKVWYVPGWNRAEKADDLAYPACTGLFGTERCEFKAWKGDCLWQEAVKNADREVEVLTDSIIGMDEEARGDLTLVGHSLGGRITARVLVRLAERKMKKFCWGLRFRWMRRILSRWARGAGSLFC